MLETELRSTMTSTEPTVSVIVPCYNSEKTIRDCLKSIIQQKTTLDYDVTVVDSSSDRTSEIVASEFPDVRLIRLEQRTFAGVARNIGFQATRAPYCLMIDSDCVAEPDLIERAYARHQEDKYGAVGGSLANGTPRSVSGTIGYLLEFKEFMPSTPKRLVPTVPSANVMYPREVFERHGGFDEAMWLAEDILFHWKMTQAGERILFDPEIRVRHLNKTGWRQVLGYQVSLGRLSAVARQRGGLPGGILLKFPPLVLLMPWARLWRALWWFGRYDRKFFVKFLLICPLYLLAASFWAFGFLVECWDPRLSIGGYPKEVAETVPADRSRGAHEGPDKK